jgi:hypothetical protein
MTLADGRYAVIIRNLEGQGQVLCLGSQSYSNAMPPIPDVV